MLQYVPILGFHLQFMLLLATIVSVSCHRCLRVPNDFYGFQAMIVSYRVPLYAGVAFGRWIMRVWKFHTTPFSVEFADRICAALFV